MIKFLYLQHSLCKAQIFCICWNFFFLLKLKLDLDEDHKEHLLIQNVCMVKYVLLFIVKYYKKSLILLQIKTLILLLEQVLTKLYVIVGKNP